MGDLHKKQGFVKLGSLRTKMLGREVLVKYSIFFKEASKKGFFVKSLTNKSLIVVQKSGRVQAERYKTMEKCSSFLLLFAELFDP